MTRHSPEFKPHIDVPGPKPRGERFSTSQTSPSQTHRYSPSEADEWVVLATPSPHWIWTAITWLTILGGLIVIGNFIGIWTMIAGVAAIVVALGWIINKTLDY